MFVVVLDCCIFCLVLPGACCRKGWGGDGCGENGCTDIHCCVKAFHDLESDEPQIPSLPTLQKPPPAETLSEECPAPIPPSHPPPPPPCPESDKAGDVAWNMEHTSPMFLLPFAVFSSALVSSTLLPTQGGMRGLVLITARSQLNTQHLQIALSNVCTLFYHLGGVNYFFFVVLGHLRDTSLSRVVESYPIVMQVRISLKIVEASLKKADTHFFFFLEFSFRSFLRDLTSHGSEISCFPSGNPL